MAFKTMKNRNTEEVKEFIDITQFTVQNTKILSDYCISFTLRGHGFSLYNVKLLQTKDKKTGEDKLFFSPSQHRGADGNWYADYGLYISPEDTQTLIGIVMKAAGCVLEDTPVTQTPPAPTFEGDDFVPADQSQLPFE